MRGHNEPTEDGTAPSEIPDSDGGFFERLVGAATDAVVTADADGTIVYANDAVESLLGYEPNRLRGEQFLDFVPERLRDRYDEWHARYASGDAGTPVDDDAFEVTWLTADGDEKRLSASVFEHESDGRKLITGIFRDAPDLGEQGERLREEEALIEELFDTSPVAVAVRDADGDLLRANQRAAELVGAGANAEEFPYDTEKHEATSEWKVYDADGDRLAEEEFPVSRAVESGESVFNEVVVVERPDGSQVWLSVNAAPVYDGSEVQRIVSTAEDITELKETQVELEQRREELETELAEVFRRVTDAFFALNDDWEFTYVNDTAEELLRRTEIDLVGERFWEEFPEAVGTTFQHEYERAMETQEPVSFVEYYPPLSTWFDVRAYPSDTGLSVYFQDVTERIQRERELERYETVVETVEDGIYIVGNDGTFSMVNSKFVELVGYDRDELIGTSPTILYDDRTATTARKLQDEILRGERGSATIEHLLRTSEGETVPVETMFVVRETNDGHERVGVTRDITDRERFEQTLTALHESSRELLQLEAAESVAESVIQTATDVLGIPGAGIYLSNEDGSELRPAAVSEYVADLFDDLPTFGPGDTAITWQAFADGETITFDDVRKTDLTHRDDTPLRSGIWIPLGEHGVLTVVSDEVNAFGPNDRELADLLAATAEATLDRVERERQRRQHERKLEESERRYRTLAESFPKGAVGLFDHDLRYTLVSGGIWEEVGASADDLEGSTVREALPPETADDLEPIFRKALEGETNSVETEFLGRTFKAWATPVRDSDGEIFAGLSLSQDVSESKEYERELEAQNERLDAFASMLAHELRNPLEIAQIYLDMGVADVTPDEDVVADEDAAQSFHEVEQALDRIEEMIDTLLVVTRRRGDVDGTEVVNLGEAAAEWWDTLDDRDGNLEILTDREIRADPSRLRQLLENLFRNAEEHAGPDVTVRIGDLDDDAGFYVEDDGPGIDEATREKVFEPGYSTSNVGIGFGLAVVRQLVEAHDWECEITESEAGGARFEFRGMDVVEDGE